MNEFSYHRPSTLSEAVALLEGSEDAKALAGGQSFLPVVKLGLAQPSDVVDLKGIAELRGISREGDRLVVGAATRHVEVNTSADVKGVIPALADLAGNIGDAQVRNRGTLGGALAHADPRADYPAAVMALDGIITTNDRDIEAGEFWHGLFMTELEEEEIIKRVSFRIPQKAAYAKFPHPASKYAIVGVFVAQFANGDVRVAVTGAGDAAMRVADAEAALQGNFSASALDGLSVDPSGLQSDADFSAEYRAHMIKVMAKRAVNAANG